MDFFTPYLWESCPWISYQRLHRTFVNNKWDSFTGFLIESIKQGYYVLAWFDHYYVPKHSFFQKIHKLHDCFVYGYDIEKEVFYIANFLTDNKYLYSEICRYPKS